MYWVIQENLFHENKFDDLIKFLELMKIPHSLVKVVPFVGEIEPDIDVPDGNAIVIGSYSMRRVSVKKNWYPGSFDIEDWTYTRFNHLLGKNMLNHDAETYCFGVIPSDFDGVKFIRPIADSKAFPGGIFTADELRERQELVQNVYEKYEDSLNDQTLCMVCTPKEIYEEIRVWVVDSNPVTASHYRKYGKVIHEHFDLFDYGFSNEVLTFVKKMIRTIDTFFGPETYVMDVCRTPDGLKIVEFNTLNAAGFYDCNIQKLVVALDDAYTNGVDNVLD